MGLTKKYNLLSSIYGSSYTFDQIPPQTDSIKVYNWQGMISSTAYTGSASHTVNGLNVNETYMIVAESNDPIAVEELTQTETFKVYPNPFADELTISTDNENSFVTVFNAFGQYIETIEIYNNTTTLGANYESGFYILHFQNGQTKRIVKY